MRDEIIVYKAHELSARLEVRIQNETVWLNRHQISILFDRDIKTIGKHISNSLREELKGLQVVAKFATTAADGKIYQVEHFNLDVIISIGYRVKSERGVHFRRWANKILKDYLLKGYSITPRIDRLENEVQRINEKIDQFDLQVKTSLPPNEGIFYDGQIYDAYVFISELIRSAKRSIVLIDNYIDETVLSMLDKSDENVAICIYTSKLTKELKVDLMKHNQQYPEIEIKVFRKSHDRFLIIDEEIVYHIGASLKDLGKKWFAFSKINLDAKELIRKLRIV